LSGRNPGKDPLSLIGRCGLLLLPASAALTVTAACIQHNPFLPPRPHYALVLPWCIICCSRVTRPSVIAAALACAVALPSCPRHPKATESQARQAVTRGRSFFEAKPAEGRGVAVVKLRLSGRAMKYTCCREPLPFAPALPRAHRVVQAPRLVRDNQFCQKVCQGRIFWATARTALLRGGTCVA